MLHTILYTLSLRIIYIILYFLLYLLIAYIGICIYIWKVPYNTSSAIYEIQATNQVQMQQSLYGSVGRCNFIYCIEWKQTVYIDKCVCIFLGNLGGQYFYLQKDTLTYALNTLLSLGTLEYIYIYIYITLLIIYFNHNRCGHLLQFLHSFNRLVDMWIR